MKRSVLGVCAALLISVVSGLSLIRWVSFKANSFHTVGRIVEWHEDEVFIEYALIDGDSIIASMDLPYTRQKTRLNRFIDVPVVYDLNQPRFFEIPGVYRHAPFGMIFLFVFSTLGFVLGLIQRKN